MGIPKSLQYFSIPTTGHLSKLNFRQERARNLNQTQSLPKHFNSNELDDAGVFEFSGKPTLHTIQF